MSANCSIFTVARQAHAQFHSTELQIMGSECSLITISEPGTVVGRQVDLQCRMSASESTTRPLRDGFCAPAEWEPHAFCLIGWPWRRDIWPEDGKRARPAFVGVIRAVCKFEKPGRDHCKARLISSVVSRNGPVELQIASYDWFYIATHADGLAPTMDHHEHQVAS